MIARIHLNMCKMEMALVIAISVSMLSNRAALADTGAESVQSAQQQANQLDAHSLHSEKQNASPVGRKIQSKPFQSLGIAHADSAFRYLAEKGADLFREGRFAEAENFYRAALVNAESHGVQDRQLAMLVTNLATDIRQQQRYDEAEILFDRAIDIEKKSSRKDNELMIYTARQYAELMRETCRDEVAESLMDSARSGFEKPIWGERFASVGDDADSAPRTRTKYKDNQFAQGDYEDADDRVHTTKVSGGIIQPTIVNNSGANSSIAGELKMLADIERSYQNESMQAQYLRANFPYMTSGPLFGSFGSVGLASFGNPGFGAAHGVHANHSGHHR